MVEGNHTFEFRLNSFETLNGLSGAAIASQQQVEKYWRYLVAGSRELVDSGDQDQRQAGGVQAGGVQARIARLEALRHQGRRRIWEGQR